VYNNGKNREGGVKMSNIGNKETFAKNLSYYLSRCGRDQKEVAEVVGVAPSTFNEWVKAKKYPRIDKIEILANFFGILKSDLIEDKEEKSPEEPKLSEGEKMLLDLFRRVPEEHQQLVLQMIRAALKTKG
jgi:transcriptional regulator with XRE-family HTH domain